MLHCCLTENCLGNESHTNEGPKFVASVMIPELRILLDRIMKMVVEGFAAFCFLFIAVATYLADATILKCWNHAINLKSSCRTTSLNCWNLLPIHLTKGVESGLIFNSFVRFISGSEGGFVSNTVGEPNLTHMGDALVLWQWEGIDRQTYSTPNAFRK